MKHLGYILLQIAGVLILLGGIADTAMSFFGNSLPEAHLHYLNLQKADVHSPLRNLDEALLRALGGCLIGIGIGALTLIYSSLRNGSGKVLLAFVLMITISEGINSYEIFHIGSTYYVLPVLCILITWLGAMLWQTGATKSRQ